MSASAFKILPKNSTKKRSGKLIAHAMFNDVESLSEVDTAEKMTAEHYQNEGCEFAEIGNFEAAINCFQNALRISPDNHVLHELKAQAFLNIGKWSDACLSSQKCVELASDWAEGYFTLARCQREIGEVELSMINYERACTMDPSSSEYQQEYLEMQDIYSRYVAWKDELFGIYAEEHNEEAHCCLVNLTSRAVLPVRCETQEKHVITEKKPP